MNKNGNKSQVPMRYALPCFEGRIYRVQVDGGESNPMPGDEVNVMLTMTSAPIALAIMLKNVPRGRSMPVTYGGRKIKITRE